jgi:hypothetical protein
MNYYLVSSHEHSCDYCNQSNGKTFLLETPKEYVTKDFDCYISSNDNDDLYLYFQKVISDHRSALNFYFESVSESVFQKRYNFDKDYSLIGDI